MKEILAKARRLVQPKSISLIIRPEVYSWLRELSDDSEFFVTGLIWALIEHAYDRYSPHSESDEEKVSGDD